MECHFVHVENGPDNMSAHMTFIMERLESSPYVYVFSFFWHRPCVFGRSVIVNPLFYLDETGAVVDFVGIVCGLGGDRVDLADK